MQEDNSWPTSGAVPLCPQCGGELADLDGGEWRCQTCGISFVEADETPTDKSDEPSSTVAPASDETLSGVRIRQLAALRRSLIRTQSHCIVFAGGLLFVASWMVLWILKDLRRGGPIWAMALMGLVVAASMPGFWKLAKRVREISIELRQPLLSDPETPPDFSTLSDGSQQTRNLEAMHEAAGEPPTPPEPTDAAQEP